MANAAVVVVDAAWAAVAAEVAAVAVTLTVRAAATALACVLRTSVRVAVPTTGAASRTRLMRRQSCQKRRPPTPPMKVLVQVERSLELKTRRLKSQRS